MAAGALLLLLALALLTGERRLDVVTLRDGGTLEGVVLHEGERELLLRVGSRTRRIERERVASVASTVRSLQQALDWHAAMPADVPAALMDLARFCRARGLRGEAAVFAWKVLSLDPDHAGAHELLGHRRSGERWLARDGNRYQPLERVRELRRDWGSAWELETTHYRVRSNLELGDALAIALDMERVYRAWFELFGAELAMEEVLTPMHVHVHADSASYPEIGDGRPAWYDGAARTLRVDASAGLERGRIVHEAVHQLLHATAESEERAPSGHVPGWLDEGLAEYLATAVGGPPGRLRIEPARPSPQHLAVHRAEARPYELSRVLTFDSSDFGASTRSHLKYAQVYSLVAFLLEGEERRYRPGFIDYLRGVWVGQSSTTHFEDALGVDTDELERAWKAWVAAQG